jgi:hypothetical protein
MKQIFVDVVIALVGVVLTMLFEFVSFGIRDPAALAKLGNPPVEYGNNATPEQKASLAEFHKLQDDVAERTFAVQFDLWLIALSVIVGAHVHGASKQKGKLLFPAITLFGLLLLMLALAAGSVMFPSHKTLLALTIPDVVGFAALAFTITAVRLADTP